MSKFDQLIEQYKKSFEEKLGRKDYDIELLKAIAKKLGPSIYNKDAAKVACSDKKEREKIKQSFLIGKLGLADSPELDNAIQEVCETLGSSNRNKYRVVFYYLLVERFEKQEVYKIQTGKASASEAAEESQDSSAQSKTKSSKESQSDKMEEPNGTKTNEEIIYDHSVYAAIVGFIPIPIVDVASVSGVQYHMIKKLSEKYDHVKFDDQKTKSVLAALTGGISSFELGLFARYLFKGVPFFGPIIGGTAMSGFSFFSTKLIGEIFDDHFSSGGTLSVEELTIQKMKETFNIGMKNKTTKV